MSTDFLKGPEYKRKPITTPSARRVLAFVAACGMAGSTFAYIYSFSGAQVNSILPWSVLFVLGAIVLYVPIYAIEYPVGVSTSPWRGVSWKQMSRGMPSWVTPCVVLLSLIYVAHFIWFTLHTGLGVPSIRDGQYVIGSRGRNLRTLSSSEYFVLKAEELRMLATLMITAYFMPMMYWWFRRNEQPTT